MLKLKIKYIKYQKEILNVEKMIGDLNLKQKFQICKKINLLIPEVYLK